MNLVFASNNPHKLKEVKSIVGDDYSISGLQDVGFEEDIKETADSLEGNAQIKADFVFQNVNQPCFADDTGLEVFALDMRPGVMSARYAGDNKSSWDNVKKLLHEMQTITNRKARFRTVICLILQGKHYFFEGIVEGEIATTPAGHKGFGYDPVFIPDGYQCTFADMNDAEKNQISHRARAINKMAGFLNKMKF
ncbi:MAG: non-canonical purine NTP diphosphatase [Candidatus Delongbacteria bacterium]|jgi:XTP/dITP diphosphohydrolase|nr:non-canonical purine NTP diphosphatase [Candidatus Delongbacteria bacterium]